MKIQLIDLLHVLQVILGRAATSKQEEEIKTKKYEGRNM